MRLCFITRWPNLQKLKRARAGLYYQQQRSKVNTHQASVRSLAFKWIRVLYRCWKAKEPYNESKYLKALRDRNSPLLFKEKAC